MSDALTVCVPIADDVAERIHIVCRRSEAAIFTFLGSIVKVLLFKYLGESRQLMIVIPPAGQQVRAGCRFVGGDISGDDAFGVVLNRFRNEIADSQVLDPETVIFQAGAMARESRYGCVLLYGGVPGEAVRLPHDLRIDVLQAGSLSLVAAFPTAKYDRHRLQAILLEVEQIIGLVITEKFTISVEAILAGPGRPVEMPLPFTLELKQKVEKMFREVLAIEYEIPDSGNFFELGGNSLKSIVFLSMIFETLGKKIPLQYFRRHATVAAVSTLLHHLKQDHTGSVSPAPVKAWYKALRKQEKLFYLQDKDSVAYNIPYAIRVKGRLDREKLQNTLTALVQRHEALRTSFVVIGDELMQHVGTGIDIQSVELAIAGREMKDIIAEFVRPFDLHAAPLFRVGIAGLPGEETLLLIDVHHIVSDGISSMILLRDLIRLYEGQVLSPMVHQFKDYSEWYLQRLLSVVYESSKEYWEERLGGRELVLHWPYDHQPDTESLRREGRRKYFEVNKEDCLRIEVLSNQLQSTMFCVLLTVYQVLLMKICNQEEVVMGVISSGRQLTAFEDVIGMFINTIPFRNLLDREKTFEQTVTETTALFMEDLDNSELDMEDVIPHIAIDNVFVLQNYSTQSSFRSGLSWELMTQERRVSKFNLVMIAVQMDERLNFELHYKDKLFREETIEAMIHFFRSILHMALENPAIRLGDIKLLGPQVSPDELPKEDFFYA